MTDHLIPAATRRAAAAGFLRTTLQGYEATLAVGLSANVIIGIARGEADVLALAVTAAVAILAPPLAGLRSWMSITRKGIPDAYIDAAVDKRIRDGA